MVLKPIDNNNKYYNGDIATSDISKPLLTSFRTFRFYRFQQKTYQSSLFLR